MNIKKLIRLYYTLKPLKLQQLYYRLYFKFYRPSLKTSKSPRPSKKQGQWVDDIPKKTQALDKNTFQFLNKRITVPSAADWNRKDIETLWVYNFHYFDELNAKTSPLTLDEKIQLMHRWVRENPPFTGYGWDSYTLSLRIVNWIKFFINTELNDEVLLDSLWQQYIYLSKRIEHHILANHLLANAKALFYAGLYFEAAPGSKMFAKAFKLLNKQFKEQVMEDGAHFELSPMYHAIILEDLLDIINLAQAYQYSLPSNLTSLPEKMLLWLDAMTFPDGKIGFFNDAANHIAPTYQALLAYAQRLNLSTQQQTDHAIQLTASGYYRVNSHHFNLIADCAPIHPHYQPGHAHASSLSFELYIDQLPVLVNSGTSTYQSMHLRAEQRATKAHNTIEINGKNSSDVWSSFRVGKRAKILKRSLTKHEGQISIQACHDGYRPWIHQRTWTISDSRLSISDGVDGGKSCHIASYFHFHPEVELKQLTSHQVSIIIRDKQFLFNLDQQAQINIEPSYFYPEYGKAIANQTLVIKIEKTHSMVELTHEILIDNPHKGAIST